MTLFFTVLLLLFSVQCTDSHVVYDPQGVPNGNNVWNAGVVYPTTITLQQGDSIRFVWTSQHTVFIGTGNCACTCSTTTLVGTTSPVIWDSSTVSPGDYTAYCAISNHCSLGQHFHIVVVGPPTNHPTFAPTVRATGICADSTRDGNETDIDCGGSTCVARCGLNQHCLVDSDCIPQAQCSSNHTCIPATLSPSHTPTTSSPTISPTPLPEPQSNSSNASSIVVIVPITGPKLVLTIDILPLHRYRFTAVLDSPMSWMGMGLAGPSSDTPMIGGHAIIGMPANSNPNYEPVGLYELRAKDQTQIIPISPPPNNTVSELQYTTSSTQSTLSFVATLAWLMSVDNVTVNMIFANGADVFSQHLNRVNHPRVYLPVTGMQPNGGGIPTTYGNQIDSTTAILIAHATMMMIAFGVVLCAGACIALARIGGDAKWFNYHFGFQFTGWLLALVGLALGVTYVSLRQNPQFPTTQPPHEQLGLSIVVFLSFQVLNGLLRPHLGPNKQVTQKRMVWVIIHRLVGGFILLGGLANIILGVQRFEQLNTGTTSVNVLEALRDCSIVAVVIGSVLVGAGLGVRLARAYGVMESAQQPPQPPQPPPPLPDSQQQPQTATTTAGGVANPHDLTLV